MYSIFGALTITFVHVRYQDAVYISKERKTKGHELTVIGLPSKKKKSLKTLQPFTKLHTSVKEKGRYLSGLINKHIQLVTLYIVQ